MLLKELGPRADKILDKSAFDIEMTAKGLALVDTGAMRASIYVEGSEGMGGYGAASSDAKAAAKIPGRNSGRTYPNLSTSPLPSPGYLQRIIGPSVAYAYFVEFGSHGKPFMAPAAEAHREAFFTAWYSYV